MHPLRLTGERYRWLGMLRLLSGRSATMRSELRNRPEAFRCPMAPVYALRPWLRERNYPHAGNAARSAGRPLTAAVGTAARCLDPPSRPPLMPAVNQDIPPPRAKCFARSSSGIRMPRKELVGARRVAGQLTASLARRALLRRRLPNHSRTAPDFRQCPRLTDQRNGSREVVESCPGIAEQGCEQRLREEERDARSVIEDRLERCIGRSCGEDAPGNRLRRGRNLACSETLEGLRTFDRPP